jgi:hypothetical protein
MCPYGVSRKFNRGAEKHVADLPKAGEYENPQGPVAEPFEPLRHGQGEGHPVFWRKGFSQGGGQDQGQEELAPDPKKSRSEVQEVNEGCHFSR